MSLGVLLGSCSESMVREPEAPLDRDTDFYINVKIATPAEADTRADDNTAVGSYVNGTLDEQKIHNIMFVFYNSDHQYVGNAKYTPKDGDISSVDKDIPGSIETIMHITVPVTVAAGSTKPAFVMAYVNPTPKAESDLLNDQSTALGAFRTLAEVLPSKDHPGFAMNNSVHYEEQKDNELPTIAIPLTEGKGLYTSEEAATKDGAESVVIYVERIVAKVALNQIDIAKLVEQNKITNNTVTDADDVEYTLDFDVKGWGFSNTERYTFLVKNFREDKYGNPDINESGFDYPMIFNNFTYKDLNARLNVEGDETRSLTNPSWNFNKAEDVEGTNWGISGHRSFWALSPSYYHNKKLFFPAYADEIYGENKGNKKAALEYRTYNEIYDITKNAPGKFGFANDGNAQYTLEHTMQASMVTDYQKRAVTCAVVVGQYQLKVNGTNQEYDNFYLRKIMTQDGAKNVIYPSDVKMKQAFLESNSTLFIKNPDYTEGGEQKEYITVPWSLGDGGNNEYFADFEIEHPFIKDSPVPSRYVTLKLKNVGSAKYYHQTNTGVFEAVTATNLKDVNSDLYNNLIGMLGGIEEYHKGYAYFEIPIRHLWGRNNKSIGEDEFQAQLGQYAVVRNHAYNINVTGIDGIGIGISDPDAPIIPNVENDNYSVKTEIKVQRWRVVPTQNVILRP